MIQRVNCKDPCVIVGRPGMFSYQPPTISDIIDVIYSDYGSLHINKIPVKRHCKL